MDENNVTEPAVDPWDALETELGETTDTAFENQPEADRPKDDEKDVEKPGGKEDPEKSEEPKQEEKQLFTLKHLDEVKDFTVDEMKSLAQKGLDYDRQRQKADENLKYRDFLSKLAQESGKNLDAFMDEIQDQLDRTAADKRAEKDGITPEHALDRIRFERKEAAERDASAKQKQADDESQKVKAKQQQEISEFISAHPDVAHDKIPTEVWEDVAKGKSLLNAYDAWDLKQQKSQLEAEKKNLENKAKSTGSMSTAGNKQETKDEYVMDWYSD